MDLTHDILTKRVKLMARTRGPILKRWDFYNNDVARPPYFPMLTDETAAEYQKRFKVGVGWSGAIANRLASYFRKEPIEVSFEVKGDPDNVIAKEGEAVWNDISDYNSYKTFMIAVARDAGVGQDAYTKERIVFNDKISGKLLMTDGLKGPWHGQVKIERVNNCFMYRVWTMSGIVYVEAWIRTPAGDYSLLGDPTGTPKDSVQEDLEYIEAIKPSTYDEITGEEIRPSGWAVFQNKTEKYNEPIFYKELPLQRYANMVSRPEQEEGISDIEWVIPLAHSVNHIISGAVRSVHYHGWPQIGITGVEDITQIKRGPENTIALPEGATIELLTWDQNLSGAMELQSTITDFMGALTGVPRQIMQDMEGVGKVVSGVALRLLYRNMDEACRLKEAGFKEAEEKMIKASLEVLAYHNNRGGFFDEVDVHVKYNEDRTPKDRSAEIDEDLKLLSIQIYHKLDLFLKYRGKELGIETYEDAMKQFQTWAKYDKELQKLAEARIPAALKAQLDAGGLKKDEGATNKGAADEEDEED